MVGAVSAIRPYVVSKVWGAHATNRRGPTPLLPVREPTPIIPSKQLITYLLRPDGRLQIRRHQLDREVSIRV